MTNEISSTNTVACGMSDPIRIFRGGFATLFAKKSCFSDNRSDFPDWAVHASSFCRDFRIRITGTQRFIRPDVTAEGQLILPLRETIAVGGIHKPRKAERDGQGNQIKASTG
jgi:hypothetical protein